MLHLNYEPQSCPQGQKPTQMQLFQLIPLGVSCVIPSTRLDLTPIHGISQLPILKKDRCFLPCLFVSPSEKAQLEVNEQPPKHSTEYFLAETFIAKKSEAQKSSSLIKKCLLRAKPSSNYCQICKQRFTDYNQHINHEIHRQRMNQNEFTRHIERFAIEFKEQNAFKRHNPVSEKNNKIILSEKFISRQTKKIVINREECKTISTTKIDSEIGTDL